MAYKCAEDGGFTICMCMLVSTMYKILLNILHWYPYKIIHFQELFLAYLPIRYTFLLEFRARIEMDNELPWTFSGQIFTSKTFQMHRSNGKHFHIYTCTALFFKGKCVMPVDGILYSRIFLFPEDRFLGFYYLYRQC